MTTTESRATQSSGRNRYLEGNFAPVPDEITATDLEVVGQVPAALAGRYVRTGPNPVAVEDESSYHWFSGTGMVHGVDLREGGATWYRNRWVRSSEIAARQGEDDIPRPAGGGLFGGSGNTNVFHHAGEMWAINENSLPYELSPELDTVRQWDFGGPLPAGMTAHPKFDPVTGEMHVMAYSFSEPHLWYHVVDAAGSLVRSETIDVGGPVMVHDMAITGSRVLAFDLPVLFNLEKAMSGVRIPYEWDDDYTPRVGLVPRAGTAAETIWVEVDPCYVFHPLNAYDAEDGKVVVDLVRHPSMFRTVKNGPDEGVPVLERWVIDPVTGKVGTELIDGRSQEFPRADERLAGQRHRFGYSLGAGLNELGGLTNGHSFVLKHDLDAGITTEHDLGAGRVGGEFVFVPADDVSSAEDEGWLVGYVYDRSTDTSDLVILDAHDFGPEPVATVKLPRRVPAGFHGNWIPDRALRTSAMDPLV
jgi:carotenoid cleavage dioxygenase-like enzyme